VSALPHVLVVDDDSEIRDLLGMFLNRQGFRVTGARDGREMRKVLAGSTVDLIILDIMLPGSDGLTLCRELRTESNIPIIMLTAVGDETDRIVGLEIGADDYLPKPFNPRELLARMKAVLRRIETGTPSARLESTKRVRFAGWTLDLVRRELQSPNGAVVDLSAGEYDLLLAFIERPQRVLSRDQLLDLARSRIAVPFDRSIDVQVSRLRRKIEVDGKPPLIKTVRGAGYIFTSVVERL
jgi:two-component system, OmpR family, response regulator